LNDGTYVQIAINGKNFCTSAYKAYDVIADNVIKVSITGAISIIFTFLGIIAVTVIIATCAYFVVLYLPYYRDRIESPVAVTFVSGVIAFIVSGIYLSMIDVTSTSVLQCYFVDREHGKGRAQHAPERVLEILND
jgi:solute carrier family 44 (choline transporter-like protein), member 2/4/5